MASPPTVIVGICANLAFDADAKMEADHIPHKKRLCMMRSSAYKTAMRLPMLNKVPESTSRMRPQNLVPGTFQIRRYTSSLSGRACHIYQTFELMPTLIFVLRQRCTCQSSTIPKITLYLAQGRDTVSFDIQSVLQTKSTILRMLASKVPFPTGTWPPENITNSKPEPFYMVFLT
jgi:hypothetical protein